MPKRERQTRRDATEGRQKPMGDRGAYAADTVGPAANEQLKIYRPPLQGLGSAC
jgi:hypothetical protein